MKHFVLKTLFKNRRPKEIRNNLNVSAKTTCIFIYKGTGCTRNILISLLQFFLLSGKVPVRQGAQCVVGWCAPDVAAKGEGALIDRLLRDNRSVTASLCTKQLVNSTSSVLICHLQDSERKNLSTEYRITTYLFALEYSYQWSC